MKTVYEYIKSDNVISLKLIGDNPTNPSDILDVMKFQNNLKHEYHSDRCIIDCRELNYRQTIGNILKVPCLLKESDIDDFSTALIFNLASKSYENFRLTLTEIQTKVFLGQNNINLRVFDNFEEGLKWLRKY